MVTLLLFLFVIGLIVFVHEFGHFIAAKLSNIQVDEFALGFGPKLVAFKKGETEYRINLLPFGGYVKMAGEGEYEETGNADTNPRHFEVQHPLKKLIVLLAGVFMNLVLAAVIYTFFLVGGGFKQYVPQIIPNNFPFGHVTNLVGFQTDPRDTTSPIYPFHLDKSYLFTAINDKKVYSVTDVQQVITSNRGKQISITFSDENGGNTRTIKLTPRGAEVKDKGAVGILLSPVAEISFSGLSKPFAGILYAGDMFQYNVSAIITLTKEAIKTHTASVITSNLTGPVGVYEVTGAVVQTSGVSGLFNIIALLSLAIALMNVLPLPALDGGLAFLVIIETIIRRPLSARFKAIFANIGIAFLILLMIYVTFNDIINFNVISQITHLFRK